jgi:hypothetical protein
MRRPTLRVLVALALAATTAHAVTDDAPALSSRNARYTLHAELDPAAKTISATQTLEWTNIQDVATDELWFHLYWNAWRNTASTWLLEDELRGRSRDRAEDAKRGDWSWVEIGAVHLVDPGRPRIDLAPGARFEAPDDGNAEDRTVWVIDLPRSVAPGETVTVELEWRAKIPRTFARTGFRGDFFFIAHWFPKLGVFEGELGWNCRQYHAGTEYFSDYGVYDVTLVTPSHFVVGATGREVEVTDRGDGTTARRFRQADVHGFAWTASPDYVEVRDRFEHPDLPPVDLRLLIQPEHRHQAERHLHATKAALESYGLWYGAYPYGHVTIVDPAWGSGAAGMEYPTLFTCGTGIHRPFGGGSPEGVTVHEAGHQFWYGIVGNNEFEHAWLDEGLNTYSTMRTMQTHYGDSFRTRRYLAPPGASGALTLPFPELRQDPWLDRLRRYRPDAVSDVQSTPSYLYHPGTGGSLSYSKTALWLRTLENHLGLERFQPAMAAFFEAGAFRHPTPEEFVTTFSTAAGEDLGWFFEQVLDRAVGFDYGVDSVSSERAEPKGWVGDDDARSYADGKGDDEDAGPWRTTVVVRRHEGGVFPTVVKLVYEDDTESLHPWDGRSTWHAIVQEGPTRLRYAEVDPERVLALDLDPTNNRLHREKPTVRGATKWSALWMGWLQDLLVGWASFI